MEKGGQHWDKRMQEASVGPEAGGMHKDLDQWGPEVGSGADTGAVVVLPSGIPSHRGTPAPEAESKEKQYPELSLPLLLQCPSSAFHGLQESRR